MATVPPRRHRRRHAATVTLVLTVAAYVVPAYVILPWLWTEHEDRHPALAGSPKVTHNADGIPGDPINVGLVGDRALLIKAMLAAGWKPADAITLESSLAIAASVLLDRPDPNAPVSPLFLFGRKQDLAFEEEVGSSADRRHHVRWWEAPGKDDAGRPLWLGDASFDIGSGISHLTGQITHHIAPDVDAERDRLIGDLDQDGLLTSRYWEPGIGATSDGRNAGGDRYETDGRIAVGVLRTGAAAP